MFRGIFKLPSASYALVDADGVSIERYWEAAPDFDEHSTEDELVEALSERLEQAVSRQMISDVPISLSLSSGIDSSTILALMAAHSPGSVGAFTAGSRVGRSRARSAPPLR